MFRFRQQILIACAVAFVALIITTGCASAQDITSHTQISPAPSGGFDFPAQLTFFASLATYANGIIANVTQGNFSNAAVLLANYNSTIDSLNAAANNTKQGTVMDALKASRDDFSTFIAGAKRYNDLYVNETSLSPAAARSNGSIANALEMQALSATLEGLQSTIGGRNADIYGIAVDNGLNLSQYGNSTALFKAYAAQIDSRLANVTANVFQTPTITLAGNKNNATYGDAVALAGRLQVNQTGITNGSVEIHVDNTTVATVPANATGSYAYQLVVRTIAPGRHVAFAKYAPVNVPYNPAQSPTLNFSVAKSPVTNTLSSLSSSIVLGSDLQAQGRLTTPNGPVTNATVTLVLGGTDITQTHTDQNGTYAFSVPATGYYLPAVLNGTTAYTVFDPSGQPLDRTVSAAVHIPADLSGAYGIIAAVILILLLSILLYSRGFGRWAPAAKEEVAAPVLAPVRQARPIVAPVPVARVAEAPQRISDWDGVLSEAREAFARAEDEYATKTLFEAAVTSLAAVAHVRIAAHMTHLEKSWAVAAAFREADTRLALRELTTAYELANFGDRTLTQSQREAALSAFASLRGHVSGAKEST